MERQGSSVGVLTLPTRSHPGGHYWMSFLDGLSWKEDPYKCLDGGQAFTCKWWWWCSICCLEWPFQFWVWPSKHGPGQLTLGHTAWAGGLDQVISSCPFQPQPFLILGIWIAQPSLIVCVGRQTRLPYFLEFQPSPSLKAWRAAWILIHWCHLILFSLPAFSSHIKERGCGRSLTALSHEAGTWEELCLRNIQCSLPAWEIKWSTENLLLKFCKPRVFENASSTFCLDFRHGALENITQGCKGSVLIRKWCNLFLYFCLQRVLKRILPMCIVLCTLKVTDDAGFFEEETNNVTDHWCSDPWSCLQKGMYFLCFNSCSPQPINFIPWEFKTSSCYLQTQFTLP